MLLEYIHMTYYYWTDIKHTWICDANRKTMNNDWKVEYEQMRDNFN